MGALGRLSVAAAVRAAALQAHQSELRAHAGDAPPAPGFAAALRRRDVAVVAEVKRRSPSKGVINAAIDAAEQAASYARGGAAALSILTEPAYFGGSDDDLRAARTSVALPLLKKDFHVHPLQLVQAKGLGASAALLIARALPPTVLAELMDEARRLELEVLVEVRDEAELERALDGGAPVIGVNNRDLETLALDWAVSARLVPRIPGDRVAVFESGVSSVDQVREAASLGADAVLVGSGVSAAADPTGAVRSLTGVRRQPRDA